MRILFCSRRFFPAISGMSVYAVNLLRQLVAAGHDVTMVSQYRGDAAGTRVYGGGPPPEVPGVKVIGRQSLGEEAFAEPGGADFERDVEDMVSVILAEHRKQPFDLLHAQYGYPNGWAVLLAARQLGIPTVVSIQGGDGHWVGSCCETHRLGMLNVLNHANALLIGCESFAQEVVERLGVARERFTIVPGAVDTSRFHPAPGHVPGEAADPVRLFYHGRVDRRKGSLDMMEALALLRAQGVPLRRHRLRHRPRLRQHARAGIEAGPRRALHRLCRLRRGAGASTAKPTSSSARPMPRASATPSSRPWRTACPACPAMPSAWWTACGTRRTACWSSPATSRPWRWRCAG